MRLPLVLACVVVCLLPACKEQKSGPNSGKATPEQARSTVQVWLLRNGVPEKNRTGALIRSEEFPGNAAVQGVNRCVLTFIRGWKGAQLQAPEIRFFVVRNQTDNTGEVRALSHAARLLQFDDASGVAALGFTEKFDSKTDAGYGLERADAHAARLSAMFSGIAPDSLPAFGPGARIGHPFSVATGDFESHDGQRGHLRFGMAPGLRDASPLCISPEGKLTGFFADGEAGEATLIRVGDFRLQVVAPMLKPVAIAFGKQHTGDWVQIAIHTEQLSGQPPKHVFLLSTELPAKSADGATADSDSILPIESKGMNRLSRERDNSGGWRSALRGPTEDGEEMAYRVQIGWPIAGSEETPTLFARPFVVRLTRKADDVVPKVEGLENINETRAAQMAGGKAFPLQAPVADFREFAGGREVLLELRGAPYWKRFSFTRNDWELLPPGDLSAADVAGNLCAIYVLDRNTAELRKYAIGDLKLMATVKLPPGMDYVAIAAGSNSACAPIHVFANEGVISLDPDTLQRRVLLANEEEYLRGPGLKSTLSRGFRVCGDSLTFGFAEGMKSTFTYNNDAFGLRHRFFDWTDTWSGGDGSGVSGAFGMFGRTFCNAATADGSVSRTEPADKFGPQKATLVTSSPVWFRMKAENDFGVPPTPVTVDGQSYFGTVPFAMLEAPELSLHTNTMSEIRARSLAFDPYSRRLGSVSKDRKSWVVREITPDPKMKQPVLLNWPDTSLVRGGEFRFTPVMLNGENFSAKLVGNKEAIPVKIEDGTVSFHIAKDELASLLLLKLKIRNAEREDVCCSIPIHVFGPQLPLAAPPETVVEDMDSFGAGFKTLARPKEDWRVLQSGLHTFRDPVKEIAGVVAGHLVLISKANRVDFLSLPTGKITASFPTNATASYFAGAEALFEYDSATRSLSRISVPD